MHQDAGATTVQLRRLRLRSSSFFYVRQHCPCRITKDPACPGRLVLLADGRGEVLAIETTTKETVDELKRPLPAAAPTKADPVTPVSSTVRVPPSSSMSQSLGSSFQVDGLTTPSTIVYNHSGPTRYSTLFFRVLLVSAIGLTLLGMSQSQNEPAPAPFVPEISTGELQVNPQTNSGSVDDPPPAIFVQPSN